MNRAEAQQRLTEAVAEAYRSGCTPDEVQQAVEFGCHDAGKLDLAILAGEGFLSRDVDGEDDE